MNTKDPKLTALQFNECINAQDIEGLSNLMTEDHTCIIRRGGKVEVEKPRERMIEVWKKFFSMFPDYKNTFTRVESKDDLVIITGYAFWSEKEPHDPAIWTAKIVEDLVAEWCIYDDTEENRKKLSII